MYKLCNRPALQQASPNTRCQDSAVQPRAPQQACFHHSSQKSSMKLGSAGVALYGSPRPPWMRCLGCVLHQHRQSQSNSEPCESSPPACAACSLAWPAWTSLTALTAQRRQRCPDAGPVPAPHCRRQRRALRPGRGQCIHDGCTHVRQLAMATPVYAAIASVRRS